MKKEEKIIRIEDDLYQYVNSKWIAEAEIPSDLPLTGAFVNIMLDVEKTLMGDFKKFASNEKECDIKIIDDAVKLYKKILDVDARKKDGITPALPLLEKIKNLKDMQEFNDLSYELLNDYVKFPFEMDVVEDVTDTSKQAFMLFDPQTILPDKGMYDKKFIKALMMKMYKKMIKDLLKFTPLSLKEQKEFLRDTICFDDLLRRKVKSQTENADYVKLFNPMKLDEVNEYLRPFDLKGLLTKIYQDKTPELINVGNPVIVKEFKDILNDNTFKYFIHWVYVNTLLNYAPALSKEISDTARFYSNKLMGVKENPTIEKQAYRLVSRIYSDPIGIYYGRNYFGEEAKKDITDLTYKVIDTYKERVKVNDILGEETKEKAILKLSTIKVKMGYPDNYDPFFDLLKVDENDSYFAAMKKIMKLQIKNQFDKLLKPTDFSKWAMPGHMVNACYDPFKNDITFPAAILKKPFYDVKQALEENLGGIGAVIGHEISHAFDNNGSHFDEKGIINDWWKEEDFKRFEEKTKAMIEQYDGIIYHGGKVNGKLVVSENIADNGGVAVTLEIMKGLDNPKYDLYFKNWARIWCQKAKESYIRLLLTNDVHSPAELRANITPRNFREWYETFNVKETDKMFIPEDKRIVIW